MAPDVVSSSKDWFAMAPAKVGASLSRTTSTTKEPVVDSAFESAPSEPFPVPLSVTVRLMVAIPN